MGEGRIRKKERKGKERKGKERKGKERKGKERKRKKEKGGANTWFQKHKKERHHKICLLGETKGGSVRLRKKRKEEKGRKRNGKERKRKEKKRKGGGEGGGGKKNTQIPNLTFQKYKKERAPNWMRNNQTPNKRLLPPLSPLFFLIEKGRKKREYHKTTLTVWVSYNLMRVF